jgi:hypothetical protein
MIKNWPDEASSDLEWVAKWFDCEYPPNIGVHCTGHVVIDIDTKKDGFASFEKLPRTLPRTFTVETANMGRHYYFKLPEGHPGVANGVDVLGTGIDIRGERGYVVAPDSYVEGKGYNILVDADIHEAPEWLLDLLRQHQKKEKRQIVDIPDADEGVMIMARSWLAEQEPAVEGHGGDEHTYHIACGLHDYGLSFDQALELLDQDWNPHCSPPWRFADLRRKVLNAYRYSQNEPGSKMAVTLDDFEDAAPATKGHGLIVRSAAELVATKLEKRPSLIEGLLLQRSHAQLYGKPGSGKTFMALDMGYCIALGQDWFGHKTTQTPVLYLAFEGNAMLPTRVRALVSRYKAADAPFYAVDATGLDLTVEGRQASLLSLMAELKPGLVILDTFARALQGADENSAQEVGRMLKVIAQIQKQGATVLQIHHPGKDTTRGARGSSAIFGALDTELEVSDGCLFVKKQRDIELGKDIYYDLETVEIGEVDGEPVTSCIVVPGAKKEKGPAVLTELQQKLLDATNTCWQNKGRGIMAKELREISTSYDKAVKKLAEENLVYRDADGKWRPTVEEIG